MESEGVISDADADVDARVDADAWYADGTSDDADVWTNVDDVEGDSIDGDDDTRESAEVSGRRTCADDEGEDTDG
jgi:hypothetical protein